MKRSKSTAQLLPLTLMFASTLACPSTAQGTRADYERAAQLPQRTAGKVYRDAVRPHWLPDSNRFWYRNDLANGKREFVLVDLDTASKKPAFDHARLASALTKTLNRPIAADQLPVDLIGYPSRNVLLVQVAEKTYAWDQTTNALKETEPVGRANALAPEDMPASFAAGNATTLTIINQMNDGVALFWIDGDGKHRPYGTLAAHDRRAIQTYAGHSWLITKKEGDVKGGDKVGTPLAGFVASDEPEIAVVTGFVARVPHKPEPDRNVSPDGKWTVVLHDHNVFLRTNNGIHTGDRAEEKNVAERRITTDGSATDTYEGEPIWSPDGSKFVVVKTIPAQDHKVYFVESSPTDQLQPKLHSNEYLKPGDRIAHSRPHLFVASTGKEIPVSDTLFPNPWEISELRWEPDSSRFTFVYNQRGHQILRLMAIDAVTGAAKPIIDEQSKTFIDYSGKFFLSQLVKTHEAIWMSERDGWNHLYLYDSTMGRIKNQITKGSWVVQGVDRIDEAKRQIWFRAGGIRAGQDPYYVHYCRINFDGSGLTILTEGDGTHSVSYSPDGKYLVDTYSRVDLPPVTELRRVSDGTKVMEIEHGDDSALFATGWKAPERFVAKGRDGVTDIYGVIYRPTNFDPRHKYPVIENIYAGPQDAYVPKAFAAMHGSQTLAELGFIVMQIDGMGTSKRSKAFHDVCCKNLGDAGFPDRILWIKAAAAKYPSFDLSRVGIYGTSAGGQNALGGLLLHGDFYKAGVADCGCHDNRMDKIWWNEQWMGWPIGPHYVAQSNVTLAPNLKGKLLLMVGEMDTNVDPASTMQVVNALIHADKDFELLVMPGAGHGVAGSAYGQRRLQDFFVRNLLGVEPRGVGKTATVPKSSIVDKSSAVGVSAGKSTASKP